ncbi:Yip1 domain protein [Ichthyophthirius multifiliis]|uniref:Yip1 domain protein n=1 Tax=Ichthyophthirius multifiliis TaxID=5932 RepID=G0QU64_ICHMU|nr:Yip1 domain protein [Ichthyophthirius multifiliis]EGR31245.1 Yip1 domain protein [Ichthyophthirius multifiliis]|eukprot:XP_004034731.1 Yip1 domain protein [Ichthyophthirius multifiliis]
MQNIFHHDIIKALRIGFEFCKKGLLEDQILKCLLRLIIGFFDLLEGFSKGKVLTLQTNKQVRKKKKKEKKNAKRKTQQQEVEELNDFIEKDEQDDEEGDFLPDGQKQKKKKKIEESQEQESQIQHENQEDEDDEEDEDEDEDDDTPQFQERKYTLQSEFAMLADYSIIDKVLYLINDEKILYNSPEVNESVFKYLNKIQTLLQAEWLFYQVDFLWVIQSVLSNKEVNMRIEHKKLVDFFKKIVNKLFVKIEENKLLVVEMLFRFTDFQLKNSILSNYQDIESKQNNELIETALEDDNDILEEQSKKWTEVEDRALIYNYETFKNLENCYEQLCLILNGFRSYDKQPLDVKKRIKYFKLHKNKFTAEAIFKDIYQNSKVLQQYNYNNYIIKKKVSVEKAIYKLIKMIQNKDEYKINFTLDEFKLFIEQIFINFKEYLFYFEEFFKKKKIFYFKTQIKKKRISIIY